MKKYTQFNLKDDARRAMNYLKNMVDEKHDNLPYWLVVPHGKPAYAKHSRVDDAELVASWYEGIDAVGKILDTDEGDEVKASFMRHLMSSWGEHGLRFHENYPWTHTMHSSFHEMAYVLNAMNRVALNHPNNPEVEKRISNLVNGMKELVITRKKRTFWSGDYHETEAVYKFPNDVFLQEGGFDQTCHTGRGEEAIRNGITLYPLITRWEYAKDEVALDLAKGIANYLIGASRYFNYKMEFFGHVHSAVWVAGGLVKLGRLTNEKKYIEKGKGIYDYVVSISSSFGWVPEYAQWHDLKEEHCETCCIKDMIECGIELIKAGYTEYYDVINKYTRNQLTENQVKDGSFVSVDHSLEDTDELTFRDIDKRIIGGYTGGSEPNCISLERFRSLAGCCIGTAPQALQMVWDIATVYENNRITVNVPIDKDHKDVVEVKTEYPNNGVMNISVQVDCEIAIRTYDWMLKDLKVLVGDEEAIFTRENDLIIIKGVKKGDCVKVTHSIETQEIKEVVRGREYKVYWRGSDVVDMTPRANHIRLYQRDTTVPKFYPRPEDIADIGASVVAKPTE